MNFYKINLSANLSVDQTAIMEHLKQGHGGCIQTSGGLFAASQMSLSEIKSELNARADLSSAQVEQVSSTSPDEPLSPDVKHFMSTFKV